LWGSLFVGIIALAIFSAVVGSGLWQLKAWARRAAIVVSSLVIVVNLIVFVIGFMSGQFSIPYGIVLHGLVLWVLNSMSVKAVFEPITIEPSTDIPIANKEKRLETEQGANLESRIICPDCGNAGLSKDRFCRKCGNPLK
jgi:predicted RNA-binding Zn-ribbon protein involved in translation (DUF1610 family)